MLLHCPRVQARFPRDNLHLEHQGPAWMLWAEHGGSLILKVGDLKMAAMPPGGEDAGLFLEVDLTPAASLIHKIEGFAAAQNLALHFLSPPLPAAFRAAPLLAACHIPDRKLFVFAEESRLLARPGRAGVLEMAIQGEFRTKTVPCQEGDLVVHLTPADLTGLLSYLLALARTGG